MTYTEQATLNVTSYNNQTENEEGFTAPELTRGCTQISMETQIAKTNLHVAAGKANTALEGT